MQLFVLILVSILLVFALIKWLHASQIRSSRERADQSTPLPPLPPLDETAQSTPQAPPQDRDPTLQIAREITPETAFKGTWRDEVKALRDAGRFQEALALCSKQYPRMLAFRQTMITLRSRIKAGDAHTEASLQEIYRTAILADLVKTTQQPDASANDIMAQLPNLDDPRRYWHELGYENLSLLTKTDCNMLIRHWGEPDNHNKIKNLLE